MGHKPNRKVLIVEDESIVAKDIQRRLERLGYTVVGIACSGNRAIESAGKLGPDVVLMDINLRGDMDGVEAASQIQERFDIPVVYLTAYADDRTLERAGITEPYGYIVKPFGDKELHSSIAIALYKHQAEEVLGEKTRLNQSLLDSMPCVALLMRPHTREIVASNEAAAKVGAVPGKTCYQTWRRRETPCPWCLAPELWATGQAQHLRPEGLGRVWDAHWLPVSDELYLHYAFDITERRRAEQALARSEKQFRDIFEHTIMGVYRTAPDGRVLMANPALVRMLGYSSFDELACRNLEEDGFEPGYPRSVFQEEIEKQGKVIGMESAWIMRDGSKIVVLENAHAVRDEDGNTLYYGGTVENITERRKAEDELHTLVESTVGITGQDCFDRTVKMLCEWLGADCAIIGEVTGESGVKAVSMQLDGEMIHDYAYDLEGTPCADVEEKGYCVYPEGVSTLFPDDEGLAKLKAEGYVGTPLRDKNHNVIGLLCAISRRKLMLPERTEDVMSIIAARIASEMERERAERRAQEHQSELIHVSRLSTIGQMASELAHELNQPLCATLMCLESCLRIVKSDPSNMDEVIERLESAAAQIDRAGAITSRVKGFAMKGKGPRSTVFVNDVVHKAVEFMEREMRHKQITAELSLDEKIQPIFADPIQMEQVLLNLIQNASEAMEDTPKEQRKLAIGTRMLADAVEVSVKDAGKGIDEDHVGNVFESFFTTKAEGLGIGLSISQSIVESHGGRIYFRENHDRGVTFCFTLPLRSKKA